MKTMSLFESLQQVQRLKGADSAQVKNAFFANYCSALLMVRLHDLKGMHLVKDPAHSKLTKFEAGMSDLNFWGRALFYPHDQLVKSSLAFGHADILASESGRILHSRIQKVMEVPLSDPKRVNWDEVVAMLVMLRHRFELTSTYFGKIATALSRWETLSDAGKRKAVGDGFMYLMQADPKSNLLTRMRELSGMTMLNDLKALAMKVVSFKRLGECRLTLNEEGEVISTSGFGTAAMPMFGGTNNIIKRATGVESSYGGEESVKKKSGEDSDPLAKLLKRRKRKFKAIRFKAPEGFKVRKNNDE